MIPEMGCDCVGFNIGVSNGIRAMINLIPPWDTIGGLFAKPINVLAQ